jgi:hypothetical protein
MNFVPSFTVYSLFCVLEVISITSCKHLVAPQQQRWQLPQSTKAFVVSRIFSKRAST